MIAPLLLFGVGNPSRGDDALGPLFIERAAVSLAREIADGRLEVLTDQQLQVEHALDLAGRQRVVFVDASVDAAAPFEYRRLAPHPDMSTSTHAVSPAAVLAAHSCLALGALPEAWLLAIRGERFVLGDPLTETAEANLETALAFFVDATRDSDAPIGRRFEVEGTVQGVGFRPWAHRTARRLGLGGRVWNTARGVRMEVFGSRAAVDALVVALRDAPPPAARIRSVRAEAIAYESHPGVQIVPSTEGEPAQLVLPPDVATCEACLAEVDDPRDRRHDYAFTSCTECGPRLSIARRVPYDRDTTSMAPFALCAACDREYHDVDDRRFHAETSACPVCGPRLWLADPKGEPLAARNPLGEAARLLRQGAIVGVMGIGAFHLVCDATCAVAVAELRRRKRREAQPFAVLVADVAAAEALATRDHELFAALQSAPRPIVLLPARPGTLPPEVSGPSRRVGLMLPYTPMHRALVAEVGRPLVVTSANASGGPAVIELAEAVRAVGPMVDALLLHDRRIVRRVEDSVVAASTFGIRVVRRSRGMAPAPVRLARTSPEPILAVGGHMKNTACLVVGDAAYLTPHLGDLSLVEAERAWQHEVEGFERLLGVRAEVLAYDLHPRYATTRYALGRPARLRVGVQHHVAHALAALAERQVDEPVVAVIYDGTGWGPDGTAWGSEILLQDGLRWTRVAAFRPLPLPGGERAIVDVWRVAAAALWDAFGDDAAAVAARLPLFGGVAPEALRVVLRLLASGGDLVRARGMGRWFDAVGALALGIPRAAFDGHVALALEECAAAGDALAYPVTLPATFALPVEWGTSATPAEVDPRPTIRAAVEDLLSGVDAAVVSARFHRTVIDATASLVMEVLAKTGVRRVVLGGGSFQNRILERGLVRRLGAERVVMARDVPINDGGLALGQAFAAVLTLLGEGA